MFLVDYFRITAHNLKTSSKSRLRLVFGIVGLLVVLAFTIVQIVRASVSLGNPKWAIQYARPDGGNDILPRIAICPGFHDNVTVDGHHERFHVGVISNMNCSLVHYTSDRTRQLTPVSFSRSRHTLMEREFDCYDANTVRAQAPQLTAETREDHIWCQFNSDTSVRVAAFRFPQNDDDRFARPSTRFDEWEVVESNTPTAISIMKREWVLTNGRPIFGTIYTITKVFRMFRYARNDIDHKSSVSVYMHNFFEEKHVEYYDLDFWAIIVEWIVILVFVKFIADLLVEFLSARFGLEEAQPLFKDDETATN